MDAFMYKTMQKNNLKESSTFSGGSRESVLKTNNHIPNPGQSSD